MKNSSVWHGFSLTAAALAALLVVAGTAEAQLRSAPSVPSMTTPPLQPTTGAGQASITNFGATFLNPSTNPISGLGLATPGSAPQGSFATGPRPGSPSPAGIKNLMGTIFTFDPNSGTTMGTTSGATGPMVTMLPDGTKVTQHRDGSTTSEYPEGTVQWIGRDGTKVTLFPDGSQTIEAAKRTEGELGPAEGYGNAVKEAEAAKAARMADVEEARGRVKVAEGAYLDAVRDYEDGFLRGLWAFFTLEETEKLSRRIANDPNVSATWKALLAARNALRAAEDDAAQAAAKASRAAKSADDAKLSGLKNNVTLEVEAYAQKAATMDLAALEAERGALKEDWRQLEIENFEQQVEVADAGGGALAVVAMAIRASQDVIEAKMDVIDAAIEAKKGAAAGQTGTTSSANTGQASSASSSSSASTANEDRSSPPVSSGAAPRIATPEEQKRQEEKIRREELFAKARQRNAEIIRAMDASNASVPAVAVE